jgi:hypothetical protein
MLFNGKSIGQEKDWVNEKNWAEGKNVVDE